MNNKKKSRFFNDFKDLFSSNFFKITVLTNLIYLIISITLTLTIFKENNDFIVYYEAGGKFINDINNLYNYNPDLIWQFRYFPLSASIFAPFYLMGFELGFIISQLLNFIVNILICLFIYKIIVIIKNGKDNTDDERTILFISFFLISVPQLYNYLLGQINLYICLLILASLFILLKEDRMIWQFIASIILGFTINLKPITIFIIPFLIILNFNLKQKRIEFNVKKSFIRILGAILPVLLNLIFFIVFPDLLKGFISTNFTGTEPVDRNHSFSLTKLIINGFYFQNLPFDQLTIIAVIFIIIFGISFITYLFQKKKNNLIIYGYGLGIITMLLVYFDSWDHHLLILIPILIIIIFDLNKEVKIKNRYLIPSYLFFCFVDLIFIGMWFLFSFEELFPFNFIPTIFLFLSFYGINRYLLINRNNNLYDLNKKERV